VILTRVGDGGQTWGTPTQLTDSPEPSVLNDKESVTADPMNSNFAYAIWDQLFSPS
jgi:hypothetical protein